MACLTFWKKEQHPGPTAPPAPAPGPVQPSAPGAGAVWDLPMVTSVFSYWANPSPYIILQPDGSELRIVSGSEAPFRLPWSPDVMKKRDRVPAIGEYDEREQYVADWRLQKMRDAKIGVACYQIGWSHQHASKYPAELPPLDTPLLYSWAVNNHTPGSGVLFCLSNWDAITGPGGADYFTALRRDRKWNDDDLVLSMKMYARAVAAYMLKPDYWRIDGRPVLYRGWAHTLAFYKEQFGFDILAGEITSIWRQEIKSIVGVEPYLVATSMDDPPVNSKRHFLRAWGFDCLTEYLLHGRGWTDAMGVYRNRWQTDLALCRDQKIDYIVPVTAGYDASAEGTPESEQGFEHMPTAAQFAAHVKEARQLARDNRDVCRAVGSYAWSEIREGGVIEPQMPGMLHDADEMVKAHAIACLT